MNFLQQVFSIKNEIKKNKKHKVLRILGFKISFKQNIDMSNDITDLRKKQNQNQILLKQIVRKQSMQDNIWQIDNIRFYVPNYPIDAVQKSIVDSNGFYEQKILEDLDTYISKNAVILDLGTNIGNHTLYWLLKSPQKAVRVHCFEPIKETFAILQKNIELNSLQEKTKLYNLGLNDKNTTGQIKKFEMSNIGGTNLEEGDGNIILKKLDDIDLQEATIDFIKIDVEHLELALLKGAQETLKKYKPLIFIESWPKEYNNVHIFLTELGYKLLKEYPDHNYLYKYEG